MVPLFQGVERDTRENSELVRLVEDKVIEI